MKDLQLGTLDKLTEAVILESKYQVLKWGIQDVLPSEWMMFLTEELGELAEAISEFQYREGTIKSVTHEAIQVATLSLKIAEMYGAKEERTRHFPLKKNDDVIVYDRYRFAIPLRGIVRDINPNNDGVKIELQESNNATYPVGTEVWVDVHQVSMDGPEDQGGRHEKD